MERDHDTIRECIDAGADLLRSGVRVDEAAAHACSLAPAALRPAVQVGVEARALAMLESRPAA